MMARIKRGHFTISVNILLTASIISRALALGFVMMSIYIKAGDDILDSSVIKVVNNYNINGIPYGTAVYCLMFSLIGVFVLDLMTGSFGLYGAFTKNKCMLTINVAMSSVLIVVYIIYIVLFAIVYGERFYLAKRIRQYSMSHYNGRLSRMYQYTIYQNFMDQLGCQAATGDFYACYDVFMGKLESYIHAYFGLIVTCVMCQAASIIAVEYIFRKMEVKETSGRISNRKHFLLCTSGLGILRSFLFFCRNSFNQSKIAFTGVFIKLSSIMLGIGLLVLGLTIIGNEFITDYALQGIFYRLQFYNLYLYDIITGVAASSTVLGIATVVISVLGLVGSWKKSQKLLLTSTVLSLTFQIPRLASVIIWIVLQNKINNELQFQLNIQQIGYYKNAFHFDITTQWNTMIQVLDCCGVNNASDTFDGSVRRSIFCYENAIEIFAHPSETYDDSTNFDYSDGTGTLRTTTCTSKVHYRIRMMIGWFLAITIMQIILEVVSIIFVNKEFKTYNQTLLVPTMTDILEPTEVKERLLEHTISSSQHIVLFAFRRVLQFAVNTWKRSKVEFMFWSSITVLILTNFGLMVLALDLRYDDVFGNRYITGFVFDNIVIANRTLTSSLDNFHIVVTTFSIASISLGIYAYSMVVLGFNKRFLPLCLVLVFLGIAFIASVTQIVLWEKVYRDVSDHLTSEMKSELNTYQYPDNSMGESSESSVGWNTLFIKAKCCGVKSILDSFNTTLWRPEIGQHIPVYCCKNETVLYPYSSRSNTDCTDRMTSGTYHELVCDEVIKTRLNKYSITFFIMMGIVVLSEILCILTTIFNIYQLKVKAGPQRIIETINESEEKSTVVDDPKPLVPVLHEYKKTTKTRKSTLARLEHSAEESEQKHTRKTTNDVTNEHNFEMDASKVKNVDLIPNLRESRSSFSDSLNRDQNKSNNALHNPYANKLPDEDAIVMQTLNRPHDYEQPSKTEMDADEYSL